MIITSVIGFGVLMVMMFIGIKYYIDKNGTSSNIQVSTRGDAPEPKVEYSSTVLGLVKKISQDELIAFDIEKKREMTRSISSTTKISDGYGGAIPLSSIQQGDLVEIIFLPDKVGVLAINKTSRTWVKPDLSGVLVNTSNDEVIIGKKAYAFSDKTMIFNDK